MFFPRADVIYRTGIPAPFAISQYRPEMQLIQPFREAYNQMPIAPSGPLNGPGIQLVSAAQPVAMSALLRAQNEWARRPEVIAAQAQAVMAWSRRAR